MKRILVPTDFSECSISAIKYAARIAKKVQGDIFLLHVIDLPEMAPVFPLSTEWYVHDQSVSSDIHFMMGMMEEAREKMELAKSLPELRSLHVFEAIEVGTAGEMIHTTATRTNADLIIICAHGISGVDNFTIGSQVEKVIRGTDKPVLILTGKSEKVASKIAFASDFSPESLIVFPVVKEFARCLDCEIHLMKINTIEKFETTKESKDKIEFFIQKNGLRGIPYTIYDDVLLQSGILNGAQEISADIIALATHGKHHFFTSSVTEEIVRNANCPVLTFNLGKVEESH